MATARPERPTLAATAARRPPCAQPICTTRSPSFTPVMPTIRLYGSCRLIHIRMRLSDLESILAQGTHRYLTPATERRPRTVDRAQRATRCGTADSRQPTLY